MNAQDCRERAALNRAEAEKTTLPNERNVLLASALRWDKFAIEEEEREEKFQERIAKNSREHRAIMNREKERKLKNSEPA